MSIPRKSIAIASAAAAFALASPVSFAADAPTGASGLAVSASDTVHCYGVNSCKGEADCKTTTHECKGMNECAGHGFKALQAGECLSREGVIGDLG